MPDLKDWSSARNAEILRQRVSYYWLQCLSLIRRFTTDSGFQGLFGNFVRRAEVGEGTEQARLRVSFLFSVWHQDGNKQRWQKGMPLTHHFQIYPLAHCWVSSLWLEVQRWGWTLERGRVQEKESGSCSLWGTYSLSAFKMLSAPAEAHQSDLNTMNESVWTPQLCSSFKF